MVRQLDNENFYYRWVNDKEDRVAKFLQGGYTFVTRDEVGQVGEPTIANSAELDTRVKKGVGQGVVSYLMKLPKELWDEDQAVKQREIDKTEASMKRPRTGLDYGQIDITRK
jgi:hypothetical protein